MSLLDLLLFRRTPDALAGAPDAVRAIVSRFDHLEPRRARFVASFAGVLARVAHADLAVTEAETLRGQQLLVERGHLNPEEAAVAMELARQRSELYGGTEDFLVTREFAGLASDEEKRDLLECCFAVAAADGGISGPEESRLKQIASELGLAASDLSLVRSRWNDHRDVLR
jgi:tellurite resistance protein